MERLSKKALYARQEAEKHAGEELGHRRREWEKRKDAHARAQVEHNEAVESFHNAYEAGDSDAVEGYVSLVPARSVFPARLAASVPLHTPLQTRPSS
jgi:hypothetical protein